MAAKDLGNKYVCFKCGTKFYDLKKPEAVCPKCGSDQKDSPANKPPTETRRGRLAPAPKVVAPIEPEEPEAASEEDEDLEGLGGDEEETPADEEG